METEINLALPEWAFLDGNSHLGDLLEGRNVLQHIPSFTMMEMIPLETNTIVDNKTVKTREFIYTNIFGDIEKHLVVVHYSLAPDVEVEKIIDEAIEYYTLFMDWEDNSLIIEETSKDN